MAEMLKVEYDELMARAAELEVPLPPPPQLYPQPPCAISFIVDSGTQLAYSAESIRASVTAAEQVYAELAQSLRNAALAYEEVDQAAADALTNEGSVAAPKSMRAAAPKTGGEVGAATIGPPPEVPGYNGYYDLREAIADIEAPDQGTAYTAFESGWKQYVLELQTDAVMDRFRPFQYWEGASATAVEANFEQQKRYLISLGGTYCYQIANQAKNVVEAHKWAITVHPDSYRLYITDFWYDEYGRRGYTAQQNEVLTWYVDMQEESEAVLAEYYTRAMLPLALVYPSKPPAATTINAPVEVPDDAGDTIRDTIGDVIGALPGVIGGGGGGVDTGTESGDTGELVSSQPNSNVSDMVSTLSDMASTESDTAADPYADAPPLSASMSGLPGGIKPMSVGGGGVGGVPSAPLQGPSGTDAATAGAAARPGTGGAGPGSGGAAAGGRGGMGGGIPMGGAGAGKGGEDKEGKAKHYGGEEDIYTEDRAWTSAVIGVRRRNDGSE